MMSQSKRNLILCLSVLGLLFVLQFIMPSYFVLTLTRIMIFAVFAMGYNMLMGYSGLLSLGHAMFFAVGLYASGLSSYYWGLPLFWSFLAGILASAVVSVLIGFLALKTQTVAFMIVTLMFSQVGYLLTLQFANVTGGDQGLTLPPESRSFGFMGMTLDMTSDATRYNIAFVIFAAVLMLTFAVINSPFGRLLIAIRENTNRTEMLGFDTHKIKMVAFVLSGTISGVAGSLNGLIFGYIGASSADFQNSISPLLFTLVGGAGTLLGPLVGTTLMTLLIDRLSGFTTAYLIVIGFILIIMTLWFPKGILGTVRDRWVKWLS